MVNVKGIIDVLEDGSLVEVDGDKGMVTIIEEPADSRAAVFQDSYNSHNINNSKVVLLRNFK